MSGNLMNRKLNLFIFSTKGLMKRLKGYKQEKQVWSKIKKGPTPRFILRTITASPIKCLVTADGGVRSIM